MSDPAATTPDDQADAAAPAEAADEPRAQITRQLALLGELGEMGLNIARSIERQVMAAEAAAPQAGAPETIQAMQTLALAYGRVSRAVRLTIALQSKLLKDLDEFDRAEGSREHQRRCEAERVARRDDAERMEQVDRVLDRVIRTEVADPAEADRLAREAYDRLEHDDIYGDLSTKTVSEIVAMVCRDLGVSPDWARWAQEAWAREPAPDEPPPRMTVRWLGEHEDAPQTSPAAPPPTEFHAASP